MSNTSTTHGAPQVALTAVEALESAAEELLREARAHAVMHATDGANAYGNAARMLRAHADKLRDQNPNAEPVELDETIAVAAWVRDVRRELAEFNDGGDLFVNVRGVVALARATAERIGHPVTGDLLWWARALDRWANRAREKDARIAELTAELAAERERTAAAQRTAERFDAIAQERDEQSAETTRSLLDAVRDRDDQRAAWRPGPDWPTPRSVRVAWPMPFVDTFNKAEHEFTMALFVTACARIGGDAWTPIRWRDVADTLRELHDNGTIVPSPFVNPDPPGCIDRGWVHTLGPSIAGVDPFIVPSPATAERLRRWQR